VEPAPSRPAPTLLARIVRGSLQRELEMRRDRAPHAQLGVVVDADLPAIHRAYVRLRSHFDPRSYAAYGDEAVALAEEILALVEAAYFEAHDELSRAPHRRGLRRWIDRLLARRR